jgi:hypothetical protein
MSTAKNAVLIRGGWLDGFSSHEGYGSATSDFYDG